jgi:hypothetical protein
MARNAAIQTLTVLKKAMAPTVAMQGGSMFHAHMFSMVKIAFDVAVMRLVNTPGNRLAK